MPFSCPPAATTALFRVGRAARVSALFRVLKRTAGSAVLVLLAAAVVGLLAALWVLAYVAHYSLRRRQERAAVAEFKSKFAPLLPRENAI